ncbi:MULTISPECIES: sensor histidine kinase [unclassified Sphingobium]|uniref:sensor histidine kinase n=1 Tax=unclassified Sphingobium TaxID=2611147 RepID=UPI0022244113|nr:MULTISPECIES: ATP-binding protein [unclassified Sphingobium]MCW2393999.1 two-component system phosphate regulon sensor histidine kinase PhoR [Sphingobium sp. B8D3B]MCW2417513.1 two-component system phosphate regulon sensor histidine kinase PhoR [Sphingobium sp. B8D3C]
MARIDRSIWILLLTGALATVIVYALTGSAEATLTSAVACLFGVALLFDALERRATPSLISAPAPDANGASLSQIDTLLQALPHPSLIVERGRIERCNDAALALLGRHIIGQDVRLALRHPAAIDLLTGPNQAQAPARVDIIGLGAAGQSWALDIQPIANGRLLALLFDQSDKQAAERMRVDFVANASHELRTPLAGILGFIETLRDPVAGADAATRERFLTIMDGEARRMQRLVDDLMSLSRIEADKYRSPDQPVAFAPLVEEVVQVFRQGQNKRGQDIVTQVDPDLPPVRGDRAQLSQLLHNLISNALKYGAAGTAVTVRAEPHERNMVLLAVSDQGEGIPPEHLPRLTERFYRIDSSRSRAMGGTGLGLAIVKHIVQRHGGILQFDSKVGVGTTVRVELPVFRALAGEDAAAGAARAAPAGVTESQK